MISIKMFKAKTFFCYLFIFLLLSTAESGPLSGAICSAGCAAVVVACYGAAGAVFGTVTAGAGNNFLCGSKFQD